MADLSLAQFRDLRIASPCPVKWEEMEGDGHVRFCRQCSLNVFNFSEMAPNEVAELLASRGEGERLCAGWYRRADGTMITRDCPVGLRLVRQKVRRAASRIAAALGMLIVGSAALATGRDAGRVRTYQPFAALCEWLAPTALPPPPPRQWVGGVIACPRPAPDICHDVAPDAPTFLDAVTPIEMPE